MRHFHIQLCQREWVIWGYGPRRDAGSLRGCMISPARIVIDGVELGWLHPHGRGYEYERRVCWGWRFRSENEIASTKWRLAASREECLEQAKRSVARSMEHEPETGRVLRDALADVREYSKGIL